VPVEQVAVETELDLKEGENILKLQPRYITSLSGSPRVPRFSNGLKGIDVMLNEHAR
jgi:hypothetical protein